MKKSNTAISLYCVGGSAVNIGRQIKDLEINTVYIDTSVSNLRDMGQAESIFVLENMDGAGKHRTADTFQRFADEIPKILLQCKPSDALNIVIAGLAGGSGSTGGPALASELLKMGKNVIVVGIDSTSSLRETENSLKTLQSYRGLVTATGRPLSMFYIQNTSRRDADFMAINFVNLMSVIIDKSKTDEFDIADLTSFLSFDRVTPNGPTMAMIEFSDNSEFLAEKGTTVVGTVFVTKDRNAVMSPVHPEYLATCVVTDPSFQEDQLRINSILGKSLIIAERLQHRITTAMENKQIYGAKDLQVKTDSDGMVF